MFGSRNKCGEDLIYYYFLNSSNIFLSQTLQLHSWPTVIFTAPPPDDITLPGNSIGKIAFVLESPNVLTPVHSA